MSNFFGIFADFPTWLLIIICIALITIVWGLSSVALRSQLKRGLTLSDAKDEMEIRKAFFTIVGMVSIVITIAFTASEVSVAVRAENREQLYAALGQLAESNAQNPEVSAAALLQLG
jgi:amino acid transporter